jgi:uncharacterized protein (DUF2384 family)
MDDLSMSTMNLEDRVAATRVIINILDTWGLSDSQQVDVLGLPSGTPARAVRRYRQDTPLPDDTGVMERINHVIGIAEALRTTFPRNANMGPEWMRKPHRRFSQQPPVAVIAEGGLGGLISVRAQLDCAFAWQQSQDVS